MGTTAQKLQNIIDTKADLSALIKNNGGTVPAEFRKYPETIAPMIGGGGGDQNYLSALVNGNVTEFIDIYDNIETINFSFFNNEALWNNKLTKISLPNLLHGDGYLGRQINLKKIYFPKCTSLNRASFQRSAIEEVLPEDLSSLQSIPQYLFRFCKNLKYVTLPSVTNPHFGFNCFYGCSSLISVDFPNLTNDGTCETADAMFANSGIKRLDYDVIFKVCNHDFCQNCKSLTAVNMPHIRKFNGSCFYGCSSLISVDFPEATNGGSQTFFGCTSLKSIYMASATATDNRFIYNCENLEYVYLPSWNYSSTYVSDTFKKDTPGKVCTEIDFGNHTIAQIQAMSQYPWGAQTDQVKFKCSDGYITSFPA